MVKHKIIILVILISFISTCRNNKDKEEQQNNKSNSFYSERGGIDWARLPLLKPYELKKIDPEIKKNIWDITFRSELKNHSGTNVQYVGVKNDIIYIMCGDSTLFNYQYIESAWYIIVPKLSIEKGFTSEEAFSAYIKDNNYIFPKWYNIDSLALDFSNGNKLPWQPDR